MSSAQALALLLAAALSAAARSQTPADVAGAWKMTYTTRDGVKMDKHADDQDRGGEVLTGTISSPRGTVALNEVSVKGDEIAFASCASGSATRIRIDYTGTVKGDTMTLKMKAGAKEPLDVTAKRGASGQYPSVVKRISERGARMARRDD